MMNGFSLWIRCGIYIILQVVLVAAIPHSFATQIHNEFDDDPNSIFRGRWRTDSGSLYEYADGAMICIRVHDPTYQGWVNQVAIKNFRLEDDGWYVDQAIRYHDTGKLSRWMIARITIINESTFTKIIIGRTKGKTDRHRAQLWERVR